MLSSKRAYYNVSNSSRPYQARPLLETVPSRGSRSKSGEVDTHLRCGCSTVSHAFRHPSGFRPHPVIFLANHLSPQSNHYIPFRAYQVSKVLPRSCSTASGIIGRFSMTLCYRLCIHHDCIAAYHLRQPRLLFCSGDFNWSLDLRVLVPPCSF